MCMAARHCTRVSIERAWLLRGWSSVELVLSFAIRWIYASLWSAFKAMVQRRGQWRCSLGDHKRIHCSYLQAHALRHHGDLYKVSFSKLASGHSRCSWSLQRNFILSLTHAKPNSLQYWTSASRLSLLPIGFVNFDLKYICDQWEAKASRARYQK